MKKQFIKYYHETKCILNYHQRTASMQMLINYMAEILINLNLKNVFIKTELNPPLANTV